LRFVSNYRRPETIRWSRGYAERFFTVEAAIVAPGETLFKIRKYPID
jgi:hypothetical protein